MLYSKVTQLYVYIHSFSHIILHYVPSQVIDYSSLCYTAGFHCLFSPNACVSFMMRKFHVFSIFTFASYSFPSSICLFTSIALFLLDFWYFLIIINSNYLYFNMLNSFAINTAFFILQVSFINVHKLYSCKNF